MNEHPIFVPFRGQHLAAIVTAPDQPPRGVAMLLQGLGAPRSHRNGLWTRTARALAERRIASVRFDYPELGDSTGTARLAMNATPWQHAARVLDTAREAVGTEVFSVAGNCLGAKMTLELASGVDGCVSAICIIPGTAKAVLVDEGRTAPHRAAKRVSRRLPRLGKIGRRALPSQRIRARMRFIPEVARTLRTADLMFLQLGFEERLARLERAVDALVAHEPSSGHRAEVRFIPAGITSGLRLDLDLQPKVVDALVDWFDETIPGGSGGPSVSEAIAPAASELAT